jgi:hypothetical protein
MGSVLPSSNSTASLFPPAVLKQAEKFHQISPKCGNAFLAKVAGQQDATALIIEEENAFLDPALRQNPTALNEALRRIDFRKVQQAGINRERDKGFLKACTPTSPIQTK